MLVSWRKLIHTVRTRYAIPRGLVLVGGFSNGGHMAMRMALERPDAGVRLSALPLPAPSAEGLAGTGSSLRGKARDMRAFVVHTRNSMDLGALTAFVRVVQSGSFTKAAAAMDTHKAQLSRTLANLERELGVRLLERTTRRLRLTEIGDEIYQRAVSVLAGVEDIAQTAATQRAGPRGLLRISTEPEFGLVALGRWTHAYAERYPEVRVEVDLSGRSIDLAHDGFDLGIRMGPPHERDIAPAKLGELSYGLYASPAYLERNGVPEEPDQIAKHSVLMFTTPGQRNLWRLITLSRELRVERPARVQANNSLLVRDAAVRGLGLALLPNAAAKEDVARGALKRVLSAWSGPKVAVHAVFPNERPPTAKVRAFVDLATELSLA